VDWLGGSAIAKKLEELRDYLLDYYGSINEQMVSGGLTGVEIPEKPEALLRDEQCKELGLPLVAGGVLDQPYIWMQEVGVIREVQAIFRVLEEKNNTTQQ
jgi:hypothetical protein